MTSTGEVACLGDTKEEALLKAMLASGLKIPRRGALLAFDSVVESTSILEEAAALRGLGLELFALPKTTASLRALGNVREVREEDGSAEQILRSGQVDVVFSESTGNNENHSPIRTTLLQDLDELVRVRYVTFSHPEELKEPFADFIRDCTGNRLRGIEITECVVWNNVGVWGGSEVSTVA